MHDEATVIKALVLCECMSFDCVLQTELTLEEQVARANLILIVNGCRHGPDPTDVLVEAKAAYKLYREE